MRCGAVRCDAMRGHAMQGHAITTSVWAMYRNQYRILYALPGKHDTGNEIEFCDRSFHLCRMHRVMQRAIGTASDWDLGLRCCSCNPELPGFFYSFVWKVVLLSWLSDARCYYSPVAASEVTINPAVLPWLAQPSSTLSELAILVLSQIEIDNWHYKLWGKDCHVLTFSTSALLELSMNQRFWKKENGTGQRIMKLQYLCNQPPIPSLDHSPYLSLASLPLHGVFFRVSLLSLRKTLTTMR